MGGVVGGWGVNRRQGGGGEGGGGGGGGGVVYNGVASDPQCNKSKHGDVYGAGPVRPARGGLHQSLMRSPASGYLQPAAPCPTMPGSSCNPVPEVRT